MPRREAKSDAFKFLALMIWAILSFIVSRIFSISHHKDFTKLKN